MQLFLVFYQLHLCRIAEKVPTLYENEIWVEPFAKMLEVTEQKLSADASNSFVALVIPPAKPDWSGKLVKNKSQNNLH